MFRLSDGEEIMTLSFFVLIQCRSVTDGRTDGRTDGHSSSGYTSGLHSSLVKIETLGLFSHDQFYINVNEHLLLAPSDGCNITKKDDRQIKDALFEYLTTVE